MCFRCFFGGDVAIKHVIELMNLLQTFLILFAIHIFI